MLPADFVDLSAAIVSGGEQGLLGMAFPPAARGERPLLRQLHQPRGRHRRRAAAPLGGSGRRRPRVAVRSALGRRAGPAFIAQPFANHNGGHLAFGPDGYLYIGLGDGGSGNDPDHRAQNPAELLGKMLRIDVSVDDTHPSGYQVPPDNPFVRSGPPGVRPEIWAFGLRNPWRYSFDDPARGGTGALLIGDVGQNRFEEIDFEPANRGGRNYGWRNREGAHDNVTSRPPAFLPLVDPIHEYDRGVGQSVTGGFVYRGSALPASNRGRYFFADFITGRVFSIALTSTPGEKRASRTSSNTRPPCPTPARSATSARSVSMPTASCIMVGYSTGRILKVIGPRRRPARADRACALFANRAIGQPELTKARSKSRSCSFASSCLRCVAGYYARRKLSASSRRAAC